MKKLEDSKIEEIKSLIELGFSPKDISEELHVNYRTVLRYSGIEGHKHVKDSTIDKMLELQSKGLSHKQIAIELGLSYATIHKYLGDQKDMNRSDYGSIVAHKTGDSFVKEENIISIKEKKNLLKLVQSSVSYEGETFTYKINTDGKVRLSSVLGAVIEFNKEQFATFVSEINELNDLIDKFTEKPPTQFTIGLDGKIRA